MSELVSVNEPGERPAIKRTDSREPTVRCGLASLTTAGHSRSACDSVAFFGTWAGRGLCVLGVAHAATMFVEVAASGSIQAAVWAMSGLRVLSVLIAYGVAGWGVATLSRLTSAAILDHLDWAGRLSDELSSRASEGVALLERIAESLEKAPAPAVAPPAPTLDRVRSMAEIVRAAKAAEWTEAEARFKELETDWPDDPQVTNLKEELARTRQDFINNGLDQLAAAQAVSDADRVFEIYQSVAPSLDHDRRAALDPELARWFLALIHRRLRTGKVQAEVVALAARFADNFSATVEGASVRASLPTLRRSVGLCPRCAQPYVGVADACPDCLRGGTQVVSMPPVSADTA